MSEDMKPWALITGAAKRIGRVIALDLAKSGWNIVVHYHTSEPEALELVNSIQGLGVQACHAEVNLAEVEDVSKLIPALAKNLKPIRLLINNASLFVPDSEDQSGKRHWAINYEAPRILSEGFNALDTDPTCKTIINILDADPSKPEFASYNKSKIALRALTLRNAKDFAPRTCVHGIELGPILPSPRESHEHFEAMVNKSPLKRRASPEDIATAVNFLIKIPSMTGNILSLDGGVHLKWQEYENENRQLTKFSK